MTVHQPLAQPLALTAGSPLVALWQELDKRFAESEGDRLQLPGHRLAELGLSLRDLGCAYLDSGAIVIERGGFYQSAGLWSREQPGRRVATGLVPGPDGRDHPRRPPKPAGCFYQRYDRQSETTVGLETLDLDRHLDLFHKWQNEPRVAYFWEENKSKAELADYLSVRIANPSILPVIASFDGDPAGYLEFYWGREDRLGAYYASDPWDRGWHGLIGETKHLGRNKTAAWIKSLTHYLFLDCPMTEKVVGEPRADNVKLLRYTGPIGYRKIREFDFPHKRAALMHCERDEFFAIARF
ncbi:acetyltransferase [Jiella sp. MQZ9-1]|uniref:Acetyltransferase n=1 Tax=Jiella flava TaxID=2816857 RepID=A0A939FZM6_9HYPH|nr:GNAT family N-acetyltransferase [Jiella flava]MBO0662309.1 acetyltransferase [Jiella flava]MCD2470860.1 acetyltransferase [Jiella flava]